MKKIWSKIERWIIYLCLVSIIIVQVINFIFSDFPVSISNGTALILYSGTLIVIYHQFDDNKKQRDNVLVSPKFSEGLLQLFNKDGGDIQSIDIFSHSSTTYYHCIKDSNLYIQKIRLLLCKPKSIENTNCQNEEALANYNQQRESTVLLWKDLFGLGKVKELEIKYYEFEPMFHFSIINDKYVHFGLFKFGTMYYGHSLLAHYTYENKNEISKSILSDCNAMFSSIYEQFSCWEPTVEKS